MAKGEARGWRAFIPTGRGVVKILIVLVVIKLIVKYAGPALPAQIQPYVPVF